jgi:mycothiol system anti-sigma-R factor
MSCGNPHATECHEVLALVYVYIDDEIDEGHRVEVTAHLTECPPCSQEYAAERLMKARVCSSCGCEDAPTELRTRIVTEIQRITVTYRSSS